MQKRWKQKTPKIEYRNNDSVLTKLVKINGIENIEEFMSPTKKSLHSPYLLKNIEKMCDRIIEAIKQKEVICISYDHDADGVTAGVVLERYLRQLVFPDKLYRIFAERSVGHGVQYQLDLVKDCTNLIIAVDSSTNDTEACRLLTEKGIDILIIDHHPLEEENPYALIVNPKLDDYPNKELSGVGVVWKVIQVLHEKINGKDNNSLMSNPEDYYDLVAIGMQADVMSVLEPENRYIIYQGLKNIKNVGIKAILKNAKIKKVNSNTIGYTIAPMINGSARLDKLHLAIDLLLSNDEFECNKIAKQIKELNEERKVIELQLYEEIMEQIDDNDKVIIVISNHPNRSFNGLIATKITGIHQKPAIVLNERDDGKSYGGSFRTVGDFNLRDFLKGIKWISWCQGHEGAGGVGFKQINIDKIRKEINEKLDDGYFSTDVIYDLELNQSEITMDLIQQIEEFNFITGKNFQPSRFLIKDILVESREVIGKNMDTVKIKCEGLELMRFRTPYGWAKNIRPFGILDAIGSLTMNTFIMYKTGEMIETNQMIIEDIKILC